MIVYIWYDRQLMSQLGYVPLTLIFTEELFKAIIVTLHDLSKINNVINWRISDTA
jgi:hypothetical protein